MTQNTVSWTRYAEKYDMLLQYNPFYQSLQKEVLEKTEDWDIQKDDIIVDLGAGTGNYSIAYAQKFPHANVIHIDKDSGMNAIAQAKKEEVGLQNFEVITSSVLDFNFSPSSIKACTCIHSLYTFPDPKEVLEKIYSWLRPGGHGIFVDPGRLVNVLDWQLAIGTKMLQKYGLKKTIQVLKEGKEVSKQNKEISKLQAKGVYWTHSHQQFRDLIEEVGFQILASGLTFRKISDWVVVKK